MFPSTREETVDNKYHSSNVHDDLSEDVRGLRHKQPENACRSETTTRLLVRVNLVSFVIIAQQEDSAYTSKVTVVKDISLVIINVTFSGVPSILVRRHVSSRVPTRICM